MTTKVLPLPWPDTLFLPGAMVRPISPRVSSVLLHGNEGADYDRIAGLYDLIIGNTLYNRLVWGSWASQYKEHARCALENFDDGWILDSGCGSLCFTAAAYARADVDRMVLLDRSLGMLERGKNRLVEGKFLQGDSLALPFADGAFAGAMSWGMLHVLGIRSLMLPELRRVTRTGGRVFVSSLVLSDRPIANKLLNALHAKGEAAEPETQHSIELAFKANFDVVRSKLCGSMLFLEGTAKS